MNPVQSVILALGLKHPIAPKIRFENYSSKLRKTLTNDQWNESQCKSSDVGDSHAAQKVHSLSLDCIETSFGCFIREIVAIDEV
jgi:hypothetical protein